MEKEISQLRIKPLPIQVLMKGEKNDPQKTAKLNLPFNIGKKALPIHVISIHKKRNVRREWADKLMLD
jgi:hypothetical protein